MNKKIIQTKLSQFIAIESVSADSKRLPEIINAAAFLKRELTEIGFDVQLYEKGSAPPLVVATYTVSGAKKTIGIYGHYDVQSEDPVHEWQSAPFTLVEKDGKFYARGIADNKGHVMQNIAAVSQLIEEGKLKNNIVCLFEGEEETGSMHLEYFLEEARPQLETADVFFVTDVGMHNTLVPQIFYALRGLLYFELTVTIGERDLHSGVYGNAVPNPALIVAELMGKVKDNQSGEVQIPGFYDVVRKLDKTELDLLKKTAHSEEELKREAHVDAVQSLKGLPPYLAAKILPSLDINGMVSGYTGEGPKTIIPRSSTVKFSCRLVENQDPGVVQKLVANFIKKNVPKRIKYSLKTLSHDAPFYTDIKNDMVKKTATILKQEFGNDTVFNRSGASIPAAEMLQRYFGKPIILTGFVLNDANMHSPNEKMNVELFWKGIEVLKRIYNEL